ncbi:MAG TPA: NTP transferase domain-containing protein [Mycobacteriales bacterium]|nr:NTP transferase domain-containing protein [Mycobacteriales bacterium]
MGGFDAIVLAGGSARRLGGVDKPALHVGGRSILDRVLDAVSEAVRIVLVAPPQPPRGDVTVVCEKPPGGGPVPALRAGMAELAAPTAAELVVVVAGDLPFLTPAVVAALCAAADSVLVDPDGREQWLAGAWHSTRLRQRLTRYDGSTLHGLLGSLGPQRVTGQGDAWRDVDTAAELAVARALADGVAEGGTLRG